jgi:hypothetical protein
MMNKLPARIPDRKNPVSLPGVSFLIPAMSILLSHKCPICPEIIRFFRNSKIITKKEIR